MEELPDSLDETYERMLREIRKPNQGHARRMLQCLAAAIRPLRVAELAEILAIDFNVEGIPKLTPGWRWDDHEEAVMSTCSSLVMIVDDKGESEDERKVEDSRIVQFSHFSVKEFLMSDRLAESSREVTVSQYHIQLEPAHAILAQACLGVLLRLDDHINRDNINDFPLARYAAQYWDDHARFENISSVIKDEMECLFDADRPHFAAWLWIHNKDRQGHSMSTMFPEKPEAVPLYYAARFGFRDLTARLLAEHPEDVRAKGGNERTPLHASAFYGYVDVFSLLAEYFPNLEIRGVFDQTPLHRTSYGGYLRIGQCLLDRGADINAREVDDWTPLYIAVICDQLEFARMLLERGAAIHTPSDDGETPLHAASKYGHVQVARLLLEHDADLHVRDHDGKTPSEVASHYGRQDIVQLLSEYIAKPKKESCHLVESTIGL
jgi:hypothetical protein